MAQNFDWRGYFELANKLMEDSNIPLDLEEAKLRSIVSRAYYAAYHKALILLEEKLGFQIDKNNKDKSDHRQVIDECKNGGDRRLVDVGVRLETLFSTRNQADYDDIMPINNEKAKEVIDDCRETLQIIKDINRSYEDHY